MTLSANQLRIISGKFKGKKLTSFKGQRIRPTSDRVREAIFDILTIGWEGKDVLDFFAGTGGLGIETLSRGARRVLFVENHPQSVVVLEKNISAVKLSGSCELAKLSVGEGIEFIKRKRRKFDVAFLDPPYGKGLADSTLHLIADSGIIKENGIVIAEHHYKETLLDHYQGLRKSDQRKYGSTGVSFFIAEVLVH
jgi:16S rRNA (guanine(966)-N(2))-methyltransferase RsmD